MTTATPVSGGTSPPVLYPLPDSFFQTALREAMLESLMQPAALAEAQDVRLKPGFETACWSFQPPHRIYVGNKLFVKPNIRPDLTPAQQGRYVRNHYHHEQAHGMFTERDMKRIQKALKSISAPFGTYNLVEDAFIEERYRRLAAYQFNWLEYETLSFGPRPESLLFGLIQAEGVYDTVQAGLEAWEPEEPAVKAALQEKLPRVEWYYRKMVSVRSSMALMPIVNAWLDEFGRPPPPSKGGESAGSGSSGGSGGMQDMELSVKLGTDAKALAEFDAGAKSLDAAPKLTPVTATPDHKAVAAKGQVLGEDGYDVDEGRAAKLAEKFMRLFRTQPRKVSTTTPTKRISVRHFVQGRPPYRKVVDTRRGARRIYLEIDCSGSMQGIHIEEARVLTAALSLLAQRGHVTGHIVLSGVIRGTPCWETFALPMAPSAIARIDGLAGAEGLEYTLKANEALAKAADFVFIYTDAQICDKAINKSAWHAKGLYTWGLYAGTDSDYVLDKMLEYFDKAIIRASAEDLVDAILAQI